MKPITWTGCRRSLISLLALLGAALLWSTAAHAVASDPPELSIVDATGVPGSTVAVTFALTGNTEGAAVGAQANITYDADVLDFFGQFASSECTVGSCLGNNDIIIGGPIGTGVLKLGVSPNPAVFPEVPFPTDCTAIASCKFHIKVGVPTGTTALVVSAPILTNSTGQHLDVSTANGAIIIANPTPTPTATFTPVPPTATSTRVPPTSTSTSAPHTATPTNTSGGTPTGTPSGTPTGTPGIPTATSTVPVGSPTDTPVHTATATPSHGTPTSSVPTSTATSGFRPHIQDGDSCNIVAPERSSAGGGVALLLAPALLVWARRRRF